MRKVKPEEAGIPSGSVEKYLRYLEGFGLSTHSLILCKGQDIFFEKYWAPFQENTLHRMYSVTKSFVALAIGCLVEEGKISLSDPIEKYFPEEMKDQQDPNMHLQTIRTMLMMSPAKESQDWFAARKPDRVRFYFENDRKFSRKPGSFFLYDSTGSFVLGALVEKITGMKMLDYLRKKCLNEIGFSKEARILSCPGGYSWSDSALLCTAMDLMKTARMVLNGGKWEGKQLISESFIKEATSEQISNLAAEKFPQFCSNGYGYLFWRTKYNGFFMNGMGSQYAICDPASDMIMVINSDNQGMERSLDIIGEGFYRFIVFGDKKIDETGQESKSLNQYASTLKLYTAKGSKDSPFKDQIQGKTFLLEENPMGMKWIRFRFSEDTGKMEYENEQGEKTIEFGFGKNLFSLFPQEGYSKEIGSVGSKGHYYRYAGSAAWLEERVLHTEIQIIDEYLGRLKMTFSFPSENEITVWMTKSAEDFLWEYEGTANGKASPRR